MKRHFILFVILQLAALGAFGDTTTVKGKVIGGEGLTVRLMTHADQVTYLRQTLGQLKTGQDGSFEFRVLLEETRYAWIDINFREAGLFLNPGQAYDIEINLGKQDGPVSYFDRFGVPLKFIRDDESRLNLYIQDFNQLYNDFLLSYTDHAGARNPGAFETFKRAVDLRFRNATDPYFLDYVMYKNASMQLFLRLKSRDKIGAEVLANRPPLYEQVEYMDFFHLFFEKYFLTGGKYFNYNKTSQMVNGTAGLGTIMDSLKADPVLQDEQLRELLLLAGLKDLYYAAGFKKERVVFLVNELKEKSASPDTRRIAGNLVRRFNRLQAGSPAPGFNLPAAGTARKFKLADFSGKPVYLAFFRSDIPACQAELEMARSFDKDYLERIHFIAISADRDPETLDRYLESRDLPWLTLYYDGKIDLLEAYDASTFPQFILIDENGNISRSPAPSPSEDILRIFDGF